MKKEKIRETDFDPSRELPKNRKAQYFDLIKYRFLDLFKLNLLFDIFFLPLIIVFIVFNILIINLDAAYTYSLLIYMFVSFIPCIIIIFIGLGGLIEPLKRLICNEGYLGASNFFIGLKRNIKASLLTGLIESISIFILNFGILYLSTHGIASKNNWINVMGIGFLLIQAIVITLMNFFVLMQNTIFENTYFNYFRNGFIFAFARLPINLLFLLIIPGISVGLLFIPSSIFIYIVIGINLLFITFGILIHELNAINLFDIYINEQQNPTYFRKGLRK